MKVLGYTGKFYALWDKNIEISNQSEDRHYEYVNYKYLGKVANDLEAAKAKYPDVELDESINGRKRSFSSHSYVVFDSIETFRFGKYSCKKIADVHDLDYTCWYFKQITDVVHKTFIREFLYDNWYEIRTSQGGNEYAVSRDEIYKEREIEKKTKSIKTKAQSGSKIYLNITSNPDSEGKIVIDDVTYIFPKVTVRYYKGYAYYMPVQNGAAKRIKNKSIRASLMEFDGNIYISRFEIVK